MRGVYDFGTGECMLTHPDGLDVDPLQGVAAAAIRKTDWTPICANEVPATRRARVVEVSP